MPIYQYKAMNPTGKNVGGVVDAETPREAREKLRKQHLHVTTLSSAVDPSTAGTAAPGAKKAIKLPNPFKGRNLAELAMITRQLSTLLEAGITVTDALEALVQQIQGTRYESIFRGVREKITQGASLGNALGAYPDHFSDLYVNMVRAGEAAGNLDAILVRLSDYLRDQHRLRSKVQAALVYPAVMAFVGFAVVVFLLSFVVPKITQLLVKQSASSLPLPTRGLMAVSEFATGKFFGIDSPFIYYAIVIPILVMVYLAFKTAVATPKGRRMWDAGLFRIPILGELFKKQVVSRFATTLSTLLKSGVPAAESLRIVQRVVGNKIVEETVGEVHDRIMEGADIAAPLKKSKVFPPVVGYMIAVGEQAGRLDEILERLSETYDEEIEITTQKVVSLIEPLMIVAMSVVVGFIVLAVILPIMQVANAAKGK